MKQTTPRGPTWLLVIGGLFFMGVCAGLAANKENTPELKRVLDKMNQVGKTFQSLTANISQRKYVAVLKEYETEERGTFYYARAKDGSARLRREITEPTQSIAVIDAGVATVYEPKLKQAHQINLGKHKDKVEFLAIGVGQSPSRLEENFNLNLLGQETVDGKKTHTLELSPKSAKTSAIFSKIVLWIDDAQGIPLQQKFIEPSGDFMMVKFSNVKLNAKIPESVFKVKLPKDIEVIKQ